MPKINVYLPDDLAAAVRESGIPVSPVCQKALSEAVRRVKRARRAVKVLRDPRLDQTSASRLGERLAGPMTPRLREAVRLAQVAATSTGCVETRHLLIGLLDERDNLGVLILQVLGVDAAELRDAAERIDMQEPDAGTADTAGTAGTAKESGPGSDGSWLSELSFPARLAYASTLEASIDLGHNYLGCEHLLLGLLDVEDAGAFRVLDAFGVNKDNAHRSLNAAIAGFTHGRQTSATTSDTIIEDIVRRLDAIETALAALDG